MTDQTLVRARGGDENAFRDLTDPYRSELQLHCYRILGSVQDAEDQLQETLLAAWRGLDPMRYEAKETIALAFTTGLQHLPPQQRAVLVLRDVLGYRADEVAEMLATSSTAVNSLLRRARNAFDSRLPATGRDRAPLPNSRREREIVGHFAEAVQAGETERVVALLTDDAWLTMPPEPYEYQGATAIAAFLDDRAGRRGAPLLLVPTRANSQPAFGCYFRAPHTEVGRPYGLLVLTLEEDRISAITWFSDCSVFPHFGLPRILQSRA